MTDPKQDAAALTDLDRAHAGMDANEAGRLQFYAALADTEVFVLLEREPEGDMFEPRTFPVDGAEVVLGFDRLDRLAGFAATPDGAPMPYIALPGRILAQILVDSDLGLGMNLDVAPSSTLLPVEALGWLVRTLGQDAPQARETRIKAFAPPRNVPDTLMLGLAERLARAGPIAKSALLAQLTYEDGAPGHLLAIVGADSRAEPALARAASEALTFSGIDAGFLDVGFFAADDPVVARMERVAYAFELPTDAPKDPPAPTQSGPGMDPDKPPRLI